MASYSQQQLDSIRLGSPIVYNNHGIVLYDILVALVSPEFSEEGFCSTSESFHRSKALEAAGKRWLNYRKNDPNLKLKVDFCQAPHPTRNVETWYVKTHAGLQILLAKFSNGKIACTIFLFIANQ